MVARGASSHAVTVIIAAYNAYPHIQRAIESVLRQSIGVENLEIIVVDDGSTDETAGYLDEVARDCPSLVVVHQPNSGSPAGPRNRAVGMANGRYIFFLDADDYLSDDALEAMVSVADKNGTDVVLARIKGVGGRTAPKSMFQHSTPRTSLHESNVYWTLNPMKMFRTELVRRLDLRFAEDFPWGEDQPFVAGAYFGADGISVLADKDYVFWTYLDDRSNITTCAVSLADRMPVAEGMFDFVAERTEPGELRDRLMLRHFRVELFGSAFSGFVSETDECLRAMAFERFRAIVAAHYVPAIADRLPARMRVAFHLVTEGRYDDFREYLTHLEDKVWPVTLEGARAFEQAPWFREASRAIPERLYDVTALCRARCEIARAASSGDMVDLTIACSVDLIERPAEAAELMLHGRTGQEVAVSQVSEVAGVGPDGRALFRISTSLCCEELLGAPEGVLEVWCAVRVSGLSAEARLSAGPESNPPVDRLSPVSRVLYPGVTSTLTPYVTRSGNLAFRVRHSAFAVVDVDRASDQLVLRSVMVHRFEMPSAVIVDDVNLEVAEAVNVSDGVVRVALGMLGFGSYQVLATIGSHGATAAVEIPRVWRSVVKCGGGWAVVVVRGRNVGLHRPLRWVRDVAAVMAGRVLGRNPSSGAGGAR